MKKSKITFSNNNDENFNLTDEPEEEYPHSMESYLRRHKAEMPVEYTEMLFFKEEKANFINTAVLISDLSKKSLTITQNENNIKAIITFNKINFSGELKQKLSNIIQMADEVSAHLNDGKVVLNFTYYTHTIKTE